MIKHIKVIVDNRKAHLVSRYNYDKIIPYFSFAVPNYNHILRSRPWYRKCKICNQYQSSHKSSSDHDYVPVWDGRIKLLKRDTIPAGLFKATYKDVEAEEKIRFRVTEESQGVAKRKHKHWIKSESKYAFQNQCTDKLYKAARKGEGGLILNATGSGKTRIAAMLSSRLNCNILFIVDQLVLLKQAQKEISKHLNEKVGYVGESKFHLQRVTISTIQTLALHVKDRRFLQWFKHIDVILIDELHEMLNSSNFKVIHYAQPKCVFGLTATLGLKRKPTRLQAYALCGPVLFTYPVSKGMSEGVLSKGICIQLEYENTLRNINGWTQPEAYNNKLVQNGERNHLISHLVREAVHRGKYVIVVVDRLKHIEETHSRLKSLSIPHKVVAGTYKGKGISVKKRFERKDQFESGKIKCLIVNKVFKKGIDLKRVDLIINASGKPSTNDVVQVFGRGVRLHKDKKGFICIDINDTDSRDKHRTKKNWLARAAKKRIRALKQAGITVKKIVWTDSLSSRDVLVKAEYWLQKEIKRYENII